MLRTSSRISIVPLMFVFLALTCAAQSTTEMQVTTHSAKARVLFNEGMAKMETLHWDAALQSWRKAAQADPQFALAHGHQSHEDKLVHPRIVHCGQCPYT